MYSCERDGAGSGVAGGVSGCSFGHGHRVIEAVLSAIDPQSTESYVLTRKDMSFHEV